MRLTLPVRAFTVHLTSAAVTGSPWHRLHPRIGPLVRLERERERGGRGGGGESDQRPTPERRSTGPNELSQSLSATVARSSPSLLPRYVQRWLKPDAAHVSLDASRMFSKTPPFRFLPPLPPSLRRWIHRNLQLFLNYLFLCHRMVVVFECTTRF